jgi:uncharacterized lipoprotein NlpE involved in copper resistance
MDTDLSVWNQYGMGYIPHNVVIDTDTIVRYTNSGYDESTIKNIIESYLPTGIEEPDSPLPERPVLLDCYPNPFRSETRFVIRASGSREAQLTIYNLMGQVVARFMVKVSQSGEGWLRWKGQMENGAVLPNGVYLAVLQTETGTRSLKLLKVR